jgi:transcriptional regulator with XRE-family HTH domain
MLNETDIEVQVLTGLRIKQLRVQHNNMSQEKLAFEANLSTSQISKMERGKINTSIGALSMICKAFNITLGEFFSEFNYPLPKKKVAKRK